MDCERRTRTRMSRLSELVSRSARDELGVVANHLGNGDRKRRFLPVVHPHDLGWPCLDRRQSLRFAGREVSADVRRPETWLRRCRSYARRCPDFDVERAAQQGSAGDLLFPDDQGRRPDVVDSLSRECRSHSSILAPLASGANTALGGRRGISRVGASGSHHGKPAYSRRTRRCLIAEEGACRDHPAALVSRQTMESGTGEEA